MSQRLKQFLIDVMDEKNAMINEMSNDLYYKQQFEVMVKDMAFTEQSFEPDLKKIASILLKNSTNNKYVIPLILFCIHVDKFHSTYSNWYNRDMLIDILYKIFVAQHGYRTKLKYYFWKYAFLLFIDSIVFIYFSYL